MNVFKKLGIVGVTLSIVLAIAITGVVASTGRLSTGLIADRLVRAERMADAKDLQGDFDKLALMLFYEDDDMDYVGAHMRSSFDNLDAFIGAYEGRLDDDISRAGYAALKDNQNTVGDFQDKYFEGDPNALVELRELYDLIGAQLNELATLDMAMLEVDDSQASGNTTTSRIMVVSLCVLLIIILGYTIIMVILIKPKKAKAELPEGMHY